MNQSGLQSINVFVATNATTVMSQHLDDFKNILKNFIRQNNDPKNSAYLATGGADNISYITSLLFNEALVVDEEVLQIVLTTLKIVCRKTSNRKKIHVEIVQRLLKLAKDNITNNRLVSECIYCLLNLCYEKENCEYVLESGGMEVLLDILQDLEYSRAQESATGTIHQLCTHMEGKRLLLQLHGLPIIFSLLRTCTNANTQVLCSGILHNMTGLSASIHELRQLDAIPTLVELLASEDTKLCRSVTGTLQNMSRELKSRSIILNTDCVCLMTKLLFCGEVELQCKAVAGLLNILGPLATENNRIDELRTVLSDCIVLGVLQSTIYKNNELKQVSLSEFERLWGEKMQTLATQRKI